MGFKIVLLIIQWFGLLGLFVVNRRLIARCEGVEEQNARLTGEIADLSGDLPQSLPDLRHYALQLQKENRGLKVVQQMATTRMEQLDAELGRVTSELYTLKPRPLETSNGSGSVTIGGGA